MPLTLEGRLGQCAAFRPGELTFRPATGAPWRDAEANQFALRDTGDVAAGTGCGRWRGRPCAAAAADVGPAAKLPPCNGETPPTVAALLRPSRPFYSALVAHTCSRSPVPAVRRGAPKVRP